VDVCGAEDYRERDASLVCHNMALRARFSLIRRIRAGSLSPLFADTLAESRETLSQSIRSASPGGPGAPDVVLPTLLPPASRASVASTSNPIHSPSLLGEHLPGDVPLFKTKTMPARAARSSIRGLPPCGLGGSLGNSGSIVSHNSSDTSSLLISTSVTSAHKQVLQDALRCRPTTPCG
jgi:hypothetical protein